MSSQDSIFKFIICGTDTDIGKTLISSFFVKGLNSFYWKPIQSGIESQTDSQTVEKLAQVSKEKIIKEAYVFTKPLSPHWAAEIDQKTINFDTLRLPKVKGSLIVETAGGLMVPITRNFLQIDQIKQWNLPVILVCKSSLGTLNHTLLSIEALKRRNIEILGLVVNGEKQLIENVSAARREAEGAFGSSEVYLEKLVSKARHVEIQIIGDCHGNVVHLYERDCTVQRRHQKVIERAPAVYLNSTSRQSLCSEAIKVATAANYRNAGTVEFLQDADNGEFSLAVPLRDKAGHFGGANIKCCNHDIIALFLWSCRATVDRLFRPLTEDCAVR